MVGVEEYRNAHQTQLVETNNCDVVWGIYKMLDLQLQLKHGVMFTKSCRMRFVVFGANRP